MSSPENTASMSTVLNPRFWGVPTHESVLPILDDNSCVLDIGCGTTDSRVLTALLDRASGDPTVVRLDAFADTLAQNPGTGRAAGSATALPLRSGAVHAVVTSELTPDNSYFSSEQNLANKAKLMAEIARVVLMGGHWIAYNENIDRIGGDNRPPGFVVSYLMHEQVEISQRPLILSSPLPFGVFEKYAEPINTGLIGQKARRRFRGYADEYTGALDKAYPVDEVISAERVGALKSGDMSALDSSPFPMLLYYEDSLTRKFLIRSAKAGRWLPEIVPFDHPNAEERLTRLGEPYGNKLTWDLRDRTDTVDGYLRVMQLTSKFHVKVIGKEVVILPRQELLDGFIDFRDTDIVESVQMRRVLHPTSA